jgi:outer membrane lipoprotein-sorting protein
MDRTSRRTVRGTILVAMLAAAIGGNASAETADEIIAKHIAAIGGAEKLKAVKTERLVGTMTMGGATEQPFVLELARPNRMRMVLTIDGKKNIQVFDGRNGWASMPSQGTDGPQLLPIEAARRMEDQADIDGLLLDYAAKGRTVRYVGTLDVGGVPTHELEVALKSGDVLNLYLDAKTFLLVRQAGSVEIDDEAVETVTTFDDYRPVDGLMVAHSISSRTADSASGSVIKISKVELNPDIDDGRFLGPESRPETPPSAPAQPAHPAEPPHPATPQP